MPQPPTQLYVARQRQVQRRLDAAGVEGVCCRVPVLNSYSAITLASWRPPLDATMPSVSLSALLVTQVRIDHGRLESRSPSR